MTYGETKVYHDGSHYIAIPHTTRPKVKKSKKIETNKEIKLKEIADKVFSENKDKRRKEKIEILKNEVNEIIKDEKATKEFVKTYMDKKIRNLIRLRRQRLCAGHGAGACLCGSQKTLEVRKGAVPCQ